MFTSETFDRAKPSAHKENTLIVDDNDNSSLFPHTQAFCYYLSILAGWANSWIPNPPITGDRSVSKGATETYRI